MNKLIKNRTCEMRKYERYVRSENMECYRRELYVLAKARLAVRNSVRYGINFANGTEFEVEGQIFKM